MVAEVPDSAIKLLAANIVLRAVNDWYDSVEDIERIRAFLKTCENFACLQDTEMGREINRYLNSDFYDDPTNLCSSVFVWYEKKAKTGYSFIKSVNSRQLLTDWNLWLRRIDKNVRSCITNEEPFTKQVSDSAYSRIADYKGAPLAAACVEKPRIIMASAYLLQSDYIMMSECEEFFLSTYGEDLSRIDGNDIITSLKRNWEDGTYKDKLKRGA